MKKIESMTVVERLEKLNSLCNNMGYDYDEANDIFVTRRDAWQRYFGYEETYDRAAAHMNMIFQSMPIYFNYGEKSYLVELWKGQYGINTGCEVGMYSCEGSIPYDRAHMAHYDAVSENEMHSISIILYRGSHRLFELDSQEHFWRAGFMMGYFTEPEELTMTVRLEYKDINMILPFVKGLMRYGYSMEDVIIDNNAITFDYTTGIINAVGIRRKVIQLKNKLFAKIYKIYTRRYIYAYDRVLYVYYRIPYVFGRIFKVRKFGSKKAVHKEDY